MLVNDVVEALALHGGETAVDGTFGAGGYTRAMLSAGAGRVIGFDRDPDAMEAGASLVPDPRLELVNENFSQMTVRWPSAASASKTIALDIGVSSMQLLSSRARLFVPGRRKKKKKKSRTVSTAADYLNSAEEADIAWVLRDYGEEPRAQKNRAIVAARPWRTAELAAIVRGAAGSARARRAILLTRTFQAKASI